jgi:mono/diheme cytochrome c family protein
MRAALVTLLCATAVLATGCGAVGFLGADGGDPVRGKELYVENCLSCHVLEHAGQGGPIGPNLDDAFGIPRSQGFDESTIRNVVRGQIAYPEETTATGEPGMPANIVTGQDARDVSVYVAQCAGVPDCGVGD